MWKILLTVTIILFQFHSLLPQVINPDDVENANRQLQLERHNIKTNEKIDAAAKAEKMLGLGMWQEAEKILSTINKSDEEAKLVQARYLFLNNEFLEAEKIVASILTNNPANRKALLLKARLKIEAWLLSEAEQICTKLLDANIVDEEAALILGRIKLLEKDYATALKWAENVHKWNTQNAEAYLLKSEVHLWKRQPELAEAPLRKCLEIDPFNADARFNYGYAIWRRVDATQLNDMAAQWKLALAINPLHYITNWHWGNGHTNLTYADYFHATDEEVREKLKSADSLISQNKIDEAIDLSRDIERDYPDSVLPAMLRGSAFYMAYDMDRKTRLDSAQAIFQHVLQKKNHYGPAHNALAAVIKQKRMSYLAAYDSLETTITKSVITNPENFAVVFPDVKYYPGDRVQKMVWNSLYTSKAYFQFLSKQKRQFVIPPLHIDLAIAMKSPYFRQATTFDNRQWMDIRGVGSGATAIEYVERGAHLERNVVLHEYVHLFHGRVFTDMEDRRVRQLYYNAMATNSILDYYSANNESEYLAQTYTAYFAPVKVHPLNHKAMNTAGDLKRKDPQLYAFIDSLVKKQNAYLAGDKQALASNWAQVYVNLSDRLRRQELIDSTANLAEAYLDTALVWDQNYLPVYLSYAQLRLKEKKFDESENWLNKAVQINANYAPVYTAFADLINARSQEGIIDSDSAIKTQAQNYEKALALENDLAIRAQMNRQSREFYLQNSLISEAIKVAEDYVESAPTVSTYLRDHRDEALAFANWLKGLLGYSEEPLHHLEKLVRMKPQNYDLRGQYAGVLAANGKYEKAISVLEEAQKILKAAGTPNREYMVKIADYNLSLNKIDAARQVIEPFLTRKDSLRSDSFKIIEVFARLGEITRADEKMAKIDMPKEPFSQANYHYARGQIWQAKDQKDKANEAYEQAIALNPYHIQARLDLAQNLAHANKKKEAQKIAEQAMQLPIPPGPEFTRRMNEFLSVTVK